jgi:DNA ligase-1
MVQIDINNDETVDIYTKKQDYHGFKPMLFPNEAIEPTAINRPFLASTKLDGIRAIFIDGQMMSRSFKPIQNIQLHKKFEALKVYSKEHNVIIDGEIYGHGMSFQEVTHFVMTKDTKNEKIPDALTFNCFDWIIDPKIGARDRYYQSLEAQVDNKLPMTIVEQCVVSSPSDVSRMFEKVLDQGYEGLILKQPDSAYKMGRVNFNDGVGYKFKPYQTFDAVVVDIEQGTKVREGSTRMMDAFGYSVTSGKKADRVPVDKACAFVVMYNNHEMKVSLAMTDEEKAFVWQNKDKYVGKKIEYKGMLVGSKDVPRHPVFVRYRE